MTTYAEIIDWVKEHQGISTGGCEIAHCKELCGLPVRRSPNRLGTGNHREDPCSPERFLKIREAFKHFGMI